MAKSNSFEEPSLQLPFDTIYTLRRPPNSRLPDDPIWTDNKAKLIERYLFYFALIAKHGTYIDAFAGPQQADRKDSWAAKLVLESTPRWFRHFHLFDKNKRQIARLLQLKEQQPPQNPTKKEPKRDINVKRGDCNALIKELLRLGTIKPKEATFCLLDQRTFECEWSTLLALSKYREGNRRIELFYFLPHYWLDRALAAQKDKTVIEKWWGRSDWPVLKDTPAGNRVLLFVERFKKELGYWSVQPWPIFRSKTQYQVMYFMIHATDHPSAPYAMQRAYGKAVGPRESIKEVQLELRTLR
jgi:three-Cys-motif partner protein